MPARLADGRVTNLRISLPPGFPAARPSLAVTQPLAHAWVRTPLRGCRARCELLLLCRNGAELCGLHFIFISLNAARLGCALLRSACLCKLICLLSVLIVLGTLSSQQQKFVGRTDAGGQPKRSVLCVLHTRVPDACPADVGGGSLPRQLVVGQWTRAHVP